MNSTGNSLTVNNSSEIDFFLQNCRINFTSQKLEGSYRGQSWADIEKV